MGKYATIVLFFICFGCQSNEGRNDEWRSKIDIQIYHSSDQVSLYEYIERCRLREEKLDPKYYSFVCIQNKDTEEIQVKLSDTEEKME